MRKPFVASSPLRPLWRTSAAVGLIVGVVTAGIVVRSRAAAPPALDVEPFVPMPVPVSVPITQPIAAPPPVAPIPRAKPAEPIEVIDGVRGPAVLNVWLEGCADCMPSFDAWSRLYTAGALSFPVRNIAYGNASREFARRYHVEDGLVIDAGGAVVQRYGISTFTTLVIDVNGAVVARARPIDPGYVETIDRAWRIVRLSLTR